MGSEVYGSRNLVGVIAVPGATWIYGFHTNYTRADADAELGHRPAFGANGLIPGLVLGCNAPKPARVVKRRAAATGGMVAGGLESTFVSVEKINDAQTAGWKLGKLYKRLRGGKGIFFVELVLQNPEIAQDGSASGGITLNYAWRMPNFLRQKLIAADVTALGITESDRNTDDLVRGLRSPKPPRATFKAVGVEEVGSRTTFVASSKTDSLPSGWTLVS